MSWEAHRLTSRTPAELYRVIGPNGVDHKVREMLSACWDAIPAEDRTLALWRQGAGEVLERNLAAWRGMKKPSPEEFFRDLHPDPADGHLRQAMVLCHMMLPRGKRDIPDVLRVIEGIYQRNLAAWEADDVTFTKGPRPATKARGKPATRKAAKATRRKSSRR